MHGCISFDTIAEAVATAVAAPSTATRTATKTSTEAAGIATINNLSPILDERSNGRTHTHGDAENNPSHHNKHNPTELLKGGAKSEIGGCSDGTEDEPPMVNCDASAAATGDIPAVVHRHRKAHLTAAPLRGGTHREGGKKALPLSGAVTRENPVATRMPQPPLFSPPSPKTPSSAANLVSRPPSSSLAVGGVHRNRRLEPRGAEYAFRAAVKDTSKKKDESGAGHTRDGQGGFM